MTLDWFDSIEEAIRAGPRLVHGSDEFNRACGHICQLLEDAALLFQKGSHGTTTFLAITAIEETVKAHLGLFRSAEKLETPRKKDPLFQHRSKHKLASSPTIAMGSRLDNAIGSGRTEILLDEARAGVFVCLRESALYFANKGDVLSVPQEVVSRERAREILLFAIEAFDDSIVGYTKHSFELGERLTVVFDLVAG